jgi:hypothetical protein
MKYKTYEQNPHAALIEIKRAFEEEKPYKAQSTCLLYFSYLENQRQVNKALDYIAKDDVYNYLKASMEKRSIEVSQVDRDAELINVRRYEQTLKELNEHKEFLASVKDFCIKKITICPNY